MAKRTRAPAHSSEKPTVHGSTLFPLLPSASQMHLGTLLREDVVWVGFLRIHLRTLLLGSALLTTCLVGSALVAEALAVKAAMSAAISLGHQKLECFSDSKGLVSLLVNKGSAVEIKAISHDIWCPTGAFNISYNF
ncbi:hypothetical protein Bca4012_087323 [Brassica carinata]|uniref:RNase H type-1 domain-containing protein n=1 Tax=Brassica carinata TaxID=52824 RepID=A0A8X7PES8_BRACI|nr:hypothetical protein Bca52824_088985 [Brassica carinata]